MGRAILEHTHAEKDLGIFLDDKLKFCKQAAAASSKGNQLLALIKQSFLSIDKLTLPLLVTVQDTCKTPLGSIETFMGTVQPSRPKVDRASAEKSHKACLGHQAPAISGAGAPQMPEPAIPLASTIE